MTALFLVYNVQAAELDKSDGNAGPDISPTTISYQGTLFNSAGTPVTGNIGMTFRFYDAQSGGTKVWEETRTGNNAVPVNNGLFHILLGGLTPIPTSIWNNANIYLAIQIEGDTTELSPREQVGAVPYAMQATNVIIADGSITTTKIADEAITPKKLNIPLANTIVRDRETALVAGTETYLGNAQINLDQTGKVYVQCNMSIRPTSSDFRWVSLGIAATQGATMINLPDKMYTETSSVGYTGLSISGVLDLPMPGTWTIQCEASASDSGPVVQTYSITAFQIK